MSARPNLVERDCIFISRYRAGETLQQIADSFGLTRERVRQRLAACRIDPRSGGVSVRAAQHKAQLDTAAQARLERRVLKAYGVSVQRLNEILGTTRGRRKHPIVRAFLAGRRNARVWEVEWSLSFGEWWSAWEVSGKWAQRGKGRGYWMTRIDSFRGFVPGNVRVITGSERSANAYLQKPASERVAKRRRNLGIDASQPDQCSASHQSPECQRQPIPASEDSYAHD